MALKDFVGLVQSLSPAMATLLLRGMPETLDSYGRTRTIVSGTGGPVWRRNKKGFFLGNNAPNPTASGGVTVADAAESRAVSATLLWMTLPFQIPAGESPHRILAKYDGAALGFQVYANGANQLVIGADATLRTVTSTALTGSKSAAIRWTTGGTPQLFVDGLYRVDATGTIAPTADDSPIYLANNFAGNAGSSRNSYGFFAIFNDAVLGRAITDEEIRELHDAWESIVSVFEPKRKIYLPRKATEIVATAPLLHWAGERNAQGLLLDLSGNGRNGTISGRVTQTRKPEGTCQVGHGVGDPFIQTATDAALAPSQLTLHAVFSRVGQGGLNLGAVAVIDDQGVATRAEMFSLSATTLAWDDTYADGIARWSFPVPALSNRPVSVVLRKDRTAPTVAPYVLVDGEAVTVSEVVARTGALTATAAPRFSVLNRQDKALDWDGCVKDVKVYSSLLTDAECRALYVDHALSGAQRLANRTDYPVSVAAVAAGGYAGPWRVLSGTHKWDDDGTRRRELGVTSGYITSRESVSQVYGAWYGRGLKAGDAESLYFPLISNMNASPFTTGFNGYVLVVTNGEAVALWKFTNGVPASVATTAAAAVAIGTEYEFMVTRRARDGYWAVWCRGGAYTTWTSLLTGTDNTHTTSVCLVSYVDAGGRLADVRLFPNGGTLLPTEVPDLAA